MFVLHIILITLTSDSLSCAHGILNVFLFGHIFAYLDYLKCSNVCIIYLGHMACLPPSTGSESPVENDAQSDAKNAMALAISSGSPGLPMACVSLLRSRNCKDTDHEHHKNKKYL